MKEVNICPDKATNASSINLFLNILKTKCPSPNPQILKLWSDLANHQVMKLLSPSGNESSQLVASVTGRVRKKRIKGL